MTEFTPARDVADFHSRWPEFRPTALEILASRGVTRHQAEVLAWMVDLIDRIGESDITEQ